MLTALAIVLGVAMVSGTYVLTDTISSAFDSIFGDSYKNTSAIISGREIVKESASGNATVPSSLFEKVRRLPDLAASTGSIFDIGGNSDIAKLIDKKGKAISPDAPTFGFGFDPDQPRFNPMKLKQGSWASGPHQIVIDAGTASKYHFKVGEPISVSAQGPTRRFQITGIARFGSVDSIGNATFGVFDVPTAQKLLRKEGQFDSIFLAAKPGVTPERLVREVKPLLPASAQIRTGAQQAKANSKDTKQATGFVQKFLLAFAAIALFVGAFVIFNTLSITVAQRAREFAVLRTLGASRRQILRSVLLEGLIMGVLASLTGLFLGIALAKGLDALFVALGIDLPKKGTVLETRTVIVSLAVGIGITVIASIVPALRATRIPPILAVREGATLPQSRIGTQTPAIAIGTIAVAILAIAYGLFGNGLSTGAVLLLLGVGCLALFIGVALISSRLVRPIAAVVGIPAQRLGGAAGRLARENSTRNPSRTATTAAALMIGLALVTLVATLGAGLRHADKDALERQVRADYVLTSKNGFDPFAAQAGDAVSPANGVDLVSNVRDDRARVLGDDVNVDGIDPATIGTAFRFEWKQGSDAVLAHLGSGGAIVKKNFADDHHLHVGSRLPITTPDGKTADFTVRGIHAPRFDDIDGLLGDLSISLRAFDAHFPRPKNLFTFVNAEGGASALTTQAIQQTLAPYPDVTLRTKDQWVTERSGGLNQVLNILYVLLALSVIVSLFGMVNTLVLSVFERTRELGMLRAVGMTRRQTRRMVRHESVITALIGAALGIPLGIFLAALVTKALNEDISFTVPIPTLIVFGIVAVIAGIVAAVLPARRASRLDVLSALAYE
jgi:putative ABC transport system permease protein